MQPPDGERRTPVHEAEVALASGTSEAVNQELPRGKSVTRFRVADLAQARARMAEPEAAGASSDENRELKALLLLSRDREAAEAKAHASQLESARALAAELKQECETLAQRLAGFSGEQRELEARLRTSEESLARAEAQLDHLRSLSALREYELSTEVLKRYEAERASAIAGRNLQAAQSTAQTALVMAGEIVAIADRTRVPHSFGKPLSAPQRALAILRGVRSGRLPVGSSVALGKLRKELRASPLFNQSWYVGQRPDVRHHAVDPLDHFILHGLFEGTSPNPLIDVWWLAATSTNERVSALGDYLLRGRWAEQSPNWLFDVPYYRKIAGLRHNDDALSHYLRHGRAAGLSPNPLFDAAFYAAQIPLLTACNVDPLVHYLQSRPSLEFDPHPLFSTKYYAQRHLRVADSSKLDKPLLVYYLLNGARDRSSPHPTFSARAYLDRYPDVAASGMNPLVHYVCFGKSEGRQIEPEAS
jgi:hypothetical protein